MLATGASAIPALCRAGLRLRGIATHRGEAPQWLRAAFNQEGGEGIGRCQAGSSAMVTQLAVTAKAPQDAEGPHLVGGGRDHVVGTVANHDALLGDKSLVCQDMGEKLGLMIERAVEAGSVDLDEVIGQAKVLDDALRVDRGFGGHHIKTPVMGTKASQHSPHPTVELVLIKPHLLVAIAIALHGLVHDRILAWRIQHGLETFDEGWTNELVEFGARRGRSSQARQRLLHAGKDPDPVVAQGPVEIKARHLDWRGRPGGFVRVWGALVGLGHGPFLAQPVRRCPNSIKPGVAA